jgi:hypothetical protein
MPSKMQPQNRDRWARAPSPPLIVSIRVHSSMDDSRWSARRVRLSDHGLRSIYWRVR